MESNSNRPAVQRVYTEVGCPGDVITMTCSVDGSSNITISKATYGLYATSCSDACCVPNPLYDCLEDMQAVNPDFFDYLKFICEGEPSCNVEFNGYFMDTDCGSLDADYLQILFECTAFGEEPVAFMVRNLETEYLNADDVVPWLEVVTNYGGNYKPENYSFVCPYNGVYVFSVTILTLNDQIRVRVMKNDQELFLVYPHGETHDMGSGSGVVECTSGDVVRVVVEVGGRFYATTSSYHVFSGFLLRKL